MARERRPKERVDEAEDRGKALDREARRDAMIERLVRATRYHRIFGRDTVKVLRTRRRCAGSDLHLRDNSDVLPPKVRANEPLWISSQVERLFPDLTDLTIRTIT